MQQELYAQIREVEAEHWWYVGRRRVAFDWIQDALDAHTAPRVLDLGCGTGSNLAELRQRGVTESVGMDIAPAALAFCRERSLTTLVRGDGARLPFVDAAFDVVIALDLIEHLADDEAALRDIFRVLAPGGHLVMFTPAYRFLWSLQDEVSHHFRRYTSRELRQKLERSGLTVQKLTYANTLLFPIVFAGRMALRMAGRGQRVSENELHPAWSNSLLTRVFSAEVGLLRRMDLPFGVSLLAVAMRSHS